MLLLLHLLLRLPWLEKSGLLDPGGTLRLVDRVSATFWVLEYARRQAMVHEVWRKLVPPVDLVNWQFSTHEHQRWH